MSKLDDWKTLDFRLKFFLNVLPPPQKNPNKQTKINIRLLHACRVCVHVCVTVTCYSTPAYDNFPVPLPAAVSAADLHLSSFLSLVFPFSAFSFSLLYLAWRVTYIRVAKACWHPNKTCIQMFIVWTCQSWSINCNLLLHEHQCFCFQYFCKILEHCRLFLFSGWQISTYLLTQMQKKHPSLMFLWGTLGF